MAPTLDECIAALRRLGTIPHPRIDELLKRRFALDGAAVCAQLAKENLLTPFQAKAVVEGRVEDIVLDDYTLLEPIGAGGMGKVFLAVHRHMGRRVAIKTATDKRDASSKLVKRFQREIKVISKLSSPHIVQAHDARQRNGVFYLVMEYVPGRDLHRVIREDGPLSLQRAVDYVVQASLGLRAAHHEKIIHRDIKPANLLLDDSGVVKVADLGLARPIDATIRLANDSSSELTECGQVLGTIDYMAPEQYSDTMSVDHRVDIYALGCCLHFFLTGRPVYGGKTTVDRLLAHRQQPIPPLRLTGAGARDALNEVFAKMIAKRPEERWDSMEEVAAQLKQAASGGGTMRIGSFSPTLDPESDDVGARPSPVERPSPVRKEKFLTIELVEEGKTLRVRVGGEVCNTPFNAAAAADIRRVFAELMQFQHGLRHPAERTADHRLDALNERIWREVLTGETGMLLDKACQQAGRALHVWIRGPSALADIPWEILRRRHTLFLHDNVSLARTTWTPGRAEQSPQDADSRSRLRVLFVPAEPQGLGPVHWKETLCELDQRLWYWQNLDLLQFETLDGAEDPETLHRLRNRISQRGPFDVVCFLAHGSEEGSPRIALVGSDGRPDWRDARELVPALSFGQRPPKLVMLGCCHLARTDVDEAFAGISYDLIDYGVLSVVSMQGAVSTRAAATATGSMLASLLRETPIGAAVLKCRHEMQTEWPLPVLWLHHPGQEPTAPLSPMRRLNSEVLLAEIEAHGGAPTIDEPTAEAALARMQYLREFHSLPANYDGLRDVFEQALTAPAEQRVRRAMESNSREGAAQNVLWVEARCRRAPVHRAAIQEAKQWIPAPLQDGLQQGRRLENQSHWREAAECYRKVGRQTAPGEATEILWRDLRSAAAERCAYAEARLAIEEAAQLRQQGNWTAAAGGLRSAIAVIEWLLETSPKQFALLEGPLQQWRREMEAAQLVAQAYDAFDSLNWSEAVSKWEAACGLDEAASSAWREDELMARECLRAMEAMKSAQQSAERGDLRRASQLLDQKVLKIIEQYERASEEEGGAQRRKQLISRWNHQVGARRSRARWRAMFQFQSALSLLLEGVAFEELLDEGDLHLVLRAHACDRARVADVIERLKVGDCQEDPQWLIEQLGPDSPTFFMLLDDWRGALQAAASLTSDEDREPVSFRMAVAALHRHDQQPPGDEPSHELLRESLRGFSKVLGREAFWEEWCAAHGDWDLERRAEVQRRLRSHLARRLVDCDDPASVLQRAGQIATMSAADYEELVEIALALSQHYLDTGQIQSVGPIWKAVVRLASQGNVLNTTCDRINRRTHDWVDEWKYELDWLDHRVELCEMAEEALRGALAHPNIVSLLSEVLFERGCILLVGDEQDSIRAYTDMECAYNQRHSLRNTFALLLTMIALADQAPRGEHDRLYGRAEEIHQEMQSHWPDFHFLPQIKDVLQYRRGRASTAYQEMLEALPDLEEEE